MRERNNVGEKSVIKECEEEKTERKLEWGRV